MSRCSSATSCASSRTCATTNLSTLNRGVGHLLGKPHLEAAANPLGPGRSSARSPKRSARCRPTAARKFQILKELNQAPLGEVAAIYADVNRHLANLRIVPPGAVRPSSARSRRHAARSAVPPDEKPRRVAAGARDRRDGDVPANGVARRLSADRASAAADARLSAAAADAVGLRARRADHRHAGLREGLTRLQQGQTDFDVEGMQVAFSGIPEGTAQRPARPAGIAARPAGEPARGDDDRDGRDAVRLHLRDARPARRHQGAARAAADPGAEGRDARRRVLRARRRTRRACSSTRSPQRASAGRRRWGRTIRSTGRSSGSSIGIIDGFGDNLGSSTSCARSSRRSSRRRSRRPKRISRRPPRRSTKTIARISRASSRSRRSSGASRAIRSRASSRSSCAASGRRRSRASICARARTATRGDQAWRRSRISSGACSRRRRPRIASTSSRCCRRC